MPRLAWTTTKTFRWHEFELPCADELVPAAHETAGYSQLSGVRPTGFSLKRRIGWPISEGVRHAVGSGYIERNVGRFVRKYATPDMTFLEYGCGPMNIRRYLPAGEWYNAIDIAFSEFQLRRNLKPGRKINLAIGSAKNFPVADSSVSMLVSVEVLYCIPEVERVFEESRRVLRNGGMMIVSVGNAHYEKYKALGPHPDVRNRWTFDEFLATVAKFGFEPVETAKKGYWIPLKHKRLTSFWLPITPKREDQTATFIYACRLKK